MKKNTAEFTIARTFANERKYISSVLFFGLQRLCTTNLNPVNYHIVFNRDTEYYLVKDYFPKKMNMGFECIYVDENEIIVKEYHHKQVILFYDPSWIYIVILINFFISNHFEYPLHTHPSLQIL